MITFIPIQNNNEKSIFQDRLMELAQQHSLGIISNDLPLINNLSIIENIMLPASYHFNTTQSSKDEWIKSELKSFDMDDKMYHRPNQLNQIETIIVKYIAAKLLEPKNIIFFATMHYLFSADRSAFFHFLSGESIDNLVIIEGAEYKDQIQSNITVKETDFQSWATHGLKV